MSVEIENSNIFNTENDNSVVILKSKFFCHGDDKLIQMWLFEAIDNNWMAQYMYVLNIISNSFYQLIIIVIFMFFHFFSICAFLSQLKQK